MFANLGGPLALVIWPVLLWLVVILAIQHSSKSRLKPASNQSSKASSSPKVATVTVVIAGGYAALAALLGLVAVMGIALSETVSIPVPVAEFWPALPDGATATANAQRVEGGFYEAELLLSGLSAKTRTLWAISQGLIYFVPAALAGMVAGAAYQLREGLHFRPILSQFAAIAAVLIGFGGFLSVVLGDLASSMAAIEALVWSAGIPSPDVDLTKYLPQPRFTVGIPVWPIGALLGLGALSGLLRRGAKLERDTAGLV